MRALFTSDTHYQKNPDSAALVAGKAAAASPDVIGFAGDILHFGDDLEALHAFYAHFDGFQQPKFAVAGNHDLHSKCKSAPVMMKQLEDALAEHDVHLLDRAGPLSIGGTAFVGCCGWYDYSMKYKKLDYTDEDYAGWLKEQYWADHGLVEWPGTDQETTDFMVGKLRDQIDQVAGADRIIPVTHHLPFIEAVPQTDDHAMQVGRAYLGSRRFGELYIGNPRINECFFGHLHHPAQFKSHGIMAFNVAYSPENAATTHEISESLDLSHLSIAPQAVDDFLARIVDYGGLSGRSPQQEIRDRLKEVRRVEDPDHADSFTDHLWVYKVEDGAVVGVRLRRNEEISRFIRRSPKQRAGRRRRGSRGRTS